MRRPTVSIVTATYNRSNVLGHAIRSAMSQTLEDFEHLVIGDHCTDDSAAVVERVGDSRVQWRNLDVRVGDQSGPNNAGLAAARGRYIAMLNHDDLWFPDHLSAAVEFLDQTHADLVFPIAARLRPDGAFVTLPLPPSDRYAPHVTIPASMWVFRAELLDRVGEWKNFRSIHNIPSQDWLFRAHRSGADLRLNPKLSVIMIPAGMRANAYASGTADEHEMVARELERPDVFRESILTAATLRDGRERADPPIMPAVRQAGRRLTRVVVGKAAGVPTPDKPLLPLRTALTQGRKRVIGALGLHPLSVRFLFKHGKKGAAIDELRARTGVPTVTKEEQP